METTAAPTGRAAGPVVPAPRAGADDAPSTDDGHSTAGAPGPTVAPGRIGRTDDAIDYPAVRYALACCPLLRER